TQKDEYDDSEVEKKARVLLWHKHSKVRTTSHTAIEDRLDADGKTVDHSELEERSRKEGDHAAESIQAPTTTDREGPAFQFHTQQRMDNLGHLLLAESAGTADVLPGEAAMKHDKEQLIDTEVALSRDNAKKIAAVCNAPGSDHWEQLGGRVDKWKKE